MGHQNILTLVDYFETMNNRMSLASISSDKSLVPGENINVTSSSMRLSSGSRNNNEKLY